MSRTPRATTAPLLPRQTSRADVRDRLVQQHLPLVRSLAARYRHLGEPLDDLVQVGTIGLIQAIDRFDPTRGVPLTGYATPLILGEIRRHLRDRSSTVRIPRQVHDVQSRVAKATSELVQQLHRSPTASEIAQACGVDVDLVVETLEVRRVSTPVPLDTTSAGDGDVGPVAGHTDAALVQDDGALDDVLHRVSLRPVLARLDEREKRILVLRFFRGLSQREIAETLGMSQMHVSRLLARTLDRIRAEVASGAE